MKLRATDQLHVSAVRADSLRPGDEFEVSDTLGEELLKKHANRVQRVEGGEPDAAESGEKAETAPQNKAEGAAPANKAERPTATKATATKTTTTKTAAKAPRKGRNRR